MLGSGRDFDGELAKVVKLRNDVDHVKDIVRSEAELKRFVEHLETAEAWVPIVKSPEALASPGFIPFCERYSLAQVPSWKVTEKVPCNPAKN